MNALKLISPHLKRVPRLGISMFWPPNGAVLILNGVSLMRGQPWLDYVRQHDLSYDALINHSLEWLIYSKYRVGTGGIGCYNFYGWTTGYPEVTGYIVPTFWDCYHAFQRDELKTHAIEMADWELSIQQADGGFEGTYQGSGEPPLIFDTGQVLRGLIRTYEETQGQQYLDGAIRAADWIVSLQEKDGSWQRNTYKNMKRVYDSYIAYPLVKLSQISGDSRYSRSVERNIEFVLSHQQDNGWFDLCDNTLHNNEAPITHTICYTADGLLEAGELLGRADWVQAGKRTADKMMHLAETQSRYWGRFNKNWQPRAKFVCLTGTAQLGIILMRLYRREGDVRYLNASLKIVDFLAYIQHLNMVGKNRQGGIPGAYPIWGLYSPFKYPSWATKFYIDLLLQMRDAVEE